MRTIRMNDLEKKIGLKVDKINQLEKAGLFPKRIRIGKKAVAHLEHEVDDWLKSRPRVDLNKKANNLNKNNNKKNSKGQKND